MPSILISDPVRLRQAIEFAQEAGCLDEFARGFVRLMQTLTYGMTDDKEKVAEIGRDFAPHSFTFAIWHDVRVQYEVRPTRAVLEMNGGWIYDGPGSPGDGSFPSLNVNLSRVTGQAPLHSWNVHT